MCVLSMSLLEVSCVVYRLIALVGDKYLSMRVMVCYSLPQAHTHICSHAKSRPAWSKSGARGPGVCQVNSFPHKVTRYTSESCENISAQMSPCVCVCLMQYIQMEESIELCEYHHLKWNPRDLRIKTMWCVLTDTCSESQVALCSDEETFI